MLINKADLIPQSNREEWAKYYTSQGINFLFFSAFEEQAFVDVSESREDQFGPEFELT